MKIVLKGAFFAASLGLALSATGAQAQLGAVRTEPKAASSPGRGPISRCRGRVGQIIQPIEFQRAFDQVKAQPGAGPKTQYETQRQYEARLAKAPKQTLLLSAPFLGRYRAEEQRFELWYHDLVGKGPFSSYDADRYLTLGVNQVGFSSYVGNQTNGDLTLKSKTTYDLRGFDMTGPRPKRRAFDFPFKPEYRLPAPGGGSKLLFRQPPRPGSKNALNLLRWYLDMPSAEAQANDKAMKWIYQVDAKSVFQADGARGRPGAGNSQLFNKKIINGQLSCAMIVDRNNVIKKVFQAW